VGTRTAERYAYFLLRHDANKSHVLAAHLEKLHQQVAYCEKTFALIEAGQKYSPLYTDEDRDKKQVAVVAEPFDILAIENTGQFKGTYHVLGGLLSPIDGIDAEQLHISELITRVKEDAVDEIILATNASVEGESTSLYIQRQLTDVRVKVTRLARGLPIGVDLEYADQITLTRAFEGRQTF